MLKVPDNLPALQAGCKYYSQELLIDDNFIKAG